MKLGNWELDNNMKTANLPQKAQSAFTAVTSGLVGCDYQPVLYIGSQLVNGTNHETFSESYFLYMTLKIIQPTY